MTTKYLKLLIITTLISYLIMLTFVSNYGLRHYYALNQQVEVQKKELLKLESDVISLEKFKLELQNGDYILDNALKLGYVNTGDKVHFVEYSEKIEDSSFSVPQEENKLKTIEVSEKNKSKVFFLLVSVLIGLVTTLTFSVISIKKKTS